MNRYARQIKLDEVGEKGQKTLAKARVLIVGAGGLGCAVMPYLASAGIGKLGIVDADKVEESNLHRQVLYGEQTIGNMKVEEAARELQKKYATLEIEIYPRFLVPENAPAIIEEYDLVVDATDSVGTRFLINDACVLTTTAFVYASVFKFQGQVSVFNYKNGPTYRCLFGKNRGNVENCETSGVMGTTVGLIGMFQANEVIKILLGKGEVLSGKLLVYDSLTNAHDIFQFKKNTNLLIDKYFYARTYLESQTLEISAEEALATRSFLLDVREAHELPRMELPNAMHIPLSRLQENIKILNREKEINIFCQRGVRSLKALEILKQNGLRHCRSIKGGAGAISEFLKK